MSKGRTLLTHHSSLITHHFFLSSRRERELERVAVALRVCGFKRDVARAVRGVDLKLEEAAAVCERLSARAAHGVAGLRATADEINLTGDVLYLHVRDAHLVARASLADDDELLRLAPVARLPRLRDGEHAPEVVAP